MQLIKKPDYSYLVPDRSFDGLKVFFLSRQLGLQANVSEYPLPPSQKELQNIAAHFPVNIKTMIFLNQVHGDEIIHKTNKFPSFPIADGIFTTQQNLALCIKTADCVPIFLFDKEHKVIAAVHAGWRGTALKILKKTISKMEHFYKTKPENTYLFIGPAIGQCCYEVGKEVYEVFGFLGKRRQDFFNRKKGNSYMMDLKGINAYIAELEGIPTENIDTSDLCTFCNADLFFSYRRDKEETGRNVSFITLTK